MKANKNVGPASALLLGIAGAAQAHGKYDLYALENGGPNAVSKVGWSKGSVQAGDKVTVDYASLRGGRKGGHVLSVRLADGPVLSGVGGIKAPAEKASTAPQ